MTAILGGTHSLIDSDKESNGACENPIPIYWSTSDAPAMLYKVAWGSWNTQAEMDITWKGWGANALAVCHPPVSYVCCAG